MAKTHRPSPKPVDVTAAEHMSPAETTRRQSRVTLLKALKASHESRAKQSSQMQRSTSCSQAGENHCKGYSNTSVLLAAHNTCIWYDAKHASRQQGRKQAGWALQAPQGLTLCTQHPPCIKNHAAVRPHELPALGQEGKNITITRWPDDSRWPLQWARRGHRPKRL